MSDQSKRASTASPVLVAIAGWLLPGAGYLLLKEYARGITVGLTILVLFASGLLIGGIRCLEVPGYDAHGHKLYSYVLITTSHEGRSISEHTKPEVPKASAPGEDPKTEVVNVVWTAVAHPADELRSKPWNIPQVLVGPLDVLCDWWSIQVSRPVDPSSPSIEYVAARSHSRINELGVLYTAVAGLLNLLAIIDASHRANRAEGA